jgi:hypothetical protein
MSAGFATQRARVHPDSTDRRHDRIAWPWSLLDSVAFKNRRLGPRGAASECIGALTVPRTNGQRRRWRKAEDILNCSGTRLYGDKPVIRSALHHCQVEITWSFHGKAKEFRMFST